MTRKILIITLIVLTLILAAEAAYVGITFFSMEGAAAILTTEPSEPLPSEDESTEPSQQQIEPTGITETPTETTEAPQTRFLLTFTGDSTLGSEPGLFNSKSHFISTIGEDYEYPYRNLAEYFKNDDLTLVNLESVFADSGTGASKQFVFRGPTAYINILTSSSVEAVTLANNHSKDFGTTGYETTKQALEQGGVTYVEQDGSAIYTTEGGLVVGLYAAAFLRHDDDMRKEIADLRSKGAQIIVAAMHWGNEGQYRPIADQKNWAHTLIDAGVDIVWGHHPHVLQPIEEYNDGIIYYSLGNCSFGGNAWPRDLDTAVLQQEVILQEDGTAVLGELTIIPCRISSITTGQNNFQPTPYAEGSTEYKRVLSKLDGSFTGPDLVVDYDSLKPTESEGSEDTGNTGGDTGNTGGDTGNTGGDTGNTGGDTGNTGGDTGNTGGDTGGTGGETPTPEPPPAADPAV